MLLSIMIPTKNRYKTLMPVLTTLTRIESDDVEFVVQDNTEDNTAILGYISSLGDRRIKYFHNIEKMDLTMNSELAISKCQGEYVCYIGDDDSVSKHIVSFVKELEANDIDACLFNMASFFWPDCILPDMDKPVFSYTRSIPNLQIINVVAQMKRSLSWGMLDIKYLPRVYHAVIRRKCIDEVKAACGTCFPGLVPDMANAVASSFFVKKCIFISAPVIVSGYSSSSGAGAGQRKDADYLDADGAPEKYHLSKMVVNRWYNKIPRVIDGYSLWTQAAIEALFACKKSNQINKINFSALYAKEILKYEKFRGDFFRFAKLQHKSVKTIMECIRFMFRYVFEKVCKWLRGIMAGKIVIRESITIEQACEIVDVEVERQLKQTNMSMKRRIKKHV